MYALNSQNKQCNHTCTRGSLHHHPKSKVYSSFGQLKTSKQTSAPKYSFPASTHQQHQKRYTTKEIVSSDNYGIATPMGPYYQVTDKFAYKQQAKCKMGKSVRMPTDPHYEYYNLDQETIDVEKADRKRRSRQPKASFGCSPRFEKEKSKSPGPGYYPKMKGEIKKEPAYSLTMKHTPKGADPIVQIKGTDEAVGPATYKPQNLRTTKSPHKPRWTFTNSGRTPYKSSTSLHQTYDTASSMGKQLVSSRPSKPTLTINGARRSQSPGMLKTQMQFRPMKVSIAHPSF